MSDEYQHNKDHEEQEGFKVYFIRFLQALINKKETGTELSFLGFVMLALIMLPSALFFPDKIAYFFSRIFSWVLFFILPIYLVVFHWRLLLALVGINSFFHD